MTGAADFGILVETINADEGMMRLRDALTTCHLAARALQDPACDEDDLRHGLQALEGQLALARTIAERTVI